MEERDQFHLENIDLIKRILDYTDGLCEPEFSECIETLNFLKDSAKTNGIINEEE